MCGLFCQLPWQRQTLVWFEVEIRYCPPKSRHCRVNNVLKACLSFHFPWKVQISQTISWKKKDAEDWHLSVFIALNRASCFSAQHKHLMMQDHPIVGHHILVIIACAPKPPLKVYAGVSSQNIGLIIIWVFMYIHTFWMRAVKAMSRLCICAGVPSKSLW